MVRAPHRQGDPEVHHPQRAVVAHEEVLRRDVAVHHAEQLAVVASRLVGRVQAFRCLGDDPREDREGVLALHHAGLLPRGAHEAAHGLAHQVVHGEVVRALLLTEVEDAAHVGVDDAGRDLRLVEEHVDELALLGEVGVDDLEGHQTIEAR